MQTPAFIEVPYIDPLQAFGGFSDLPSATFLDSADAGGPRARFAYIAVDPLETVRLPMAGIDAARPFARLRQSLGRARARTIPELPPFQTGVCGFLGYELGGAIEVLPQPKDGFDLPAIAYGLFDTVIAFDTEAARCWIVASDLDPARPAAAVRMADLAARLAAAPGLAPLAAGPFADWHWQTGAEDYKAAVARTIAYINAGDIFQANITARADADLPAGLDLFTLYRRLRRQAPAPFSAFVRCGDGRALLSASPERFMRLGTDGIISTRPIKGTRRRGTVAGEDAALAAALTLSEKDRAENLMIVDLLRNDISRVAEIGSIEVPALYELETFSRVHHLVSEVQGRLRPGLDAVDLLIASFPGGSVTGAPKIRAMQIIHELEPAARGPYCGSVFWAGLNGAMDSSIVIRSLMVAGSRVSAHAGGGIVADSDPEEEYQEMRTKAQPMLAALAGPDIR